MVGGLVVATLLFAFYLGVATQFSYESWVRGSCGGIFDAQARALLAGRIDLDPSVLGGEAFEREGRFYTYFGILPALLRIPLLALPERDWTTLSCALAATLATFCLLLALRDAAGAARRASPVTVVAAALAATFVASGPQFELVAKPTVYVEALLWAYAAICAFLWAALPLLAEERPSAARLLALGTCAALALLTRVTAGLALYAACGMLAVVLLRRSATLSTLRLLVPGAATLALGLAAVGLVNQSRWDHPLEFAPLTRHVGYVNDAARSARLAAYGAFELERIPYAAAYYFAPRQFREARWRGPHAADIKRLFDNVEGPPASQFENKLAWWLLAAGGLVAALFRRGAAAPLRAGIGALAGGLALPVLVVLSYGYLAFRFGAEFAPLAVLGSLVTLAGLARAAARRRWSTASVAAVLVMCGAAALQIEASWRHAAAYVASDYTDGACG